MRGTAWIGGQVLSEPRNMFFWDDEPSQDLLDLPSPAKRFDLSTIDRTLKLRQRPPKRKHEVNIKQGVVSLFGFF